LVGHISLLAFWTNQPDIVLSLLQKAFPATITSSESGFE
jgi:hypothetical protein